MERQRATGRMADLVNNFVIISECSVLQVDPRINSEVVFLTKIQICIIRNQNQVIKAIKTKGLTYKS